MNTVDPILLAAGAALLALLVGLFIGRAAGSKDRRRVEELSASLAEREARIEQLDSEKSELEAHREELGVRLIEAERERDERGDTLTSYQTQVAEHFDQTSGLLREMTLQYRTIYQHLASGAETLCPEGTPRLERDTPIDHLPGGPADANGAAAEDDAESSSAVHQEAPLQVDPRPEA